MPTSLIPHLIPPELIETAPPTTATSDPFSTYDIALGGIGFMYSATSNNPMIRETVEVQKQRFDSAEQAGEQTLSNWWIKSQSSFHGGAGQLQLEPEFPSPVDHIRYDLSKNVDPFVPGRVSRLPDTTIISSDNVVQVVGVVNAGADAVAYLTSGGAVKLISTPTGSPSIATFGAAGVSSIKSIATDGSMVYAANATDIYKLDPTSTGTAVHIATYTSGTNPVLGYQKARLMLGISNLVYEVDTTVGSPTTLGATQLRYTHPAANFRWRCFGASPLALLAAGDSGGRSTITEFTITIVSGAPVLQVQGDIATLPMGEQVLCMEACQGSYLALGTSKGVRIATFNTYTGTMTYGPLQLLPTDPVIPCVALTQRDRFIFAAGKDYDEGGLICVDTGTQTDQAGRFAWAPHLIGPTFNATAATTVTLLPTAGLLVFSVPGTGVLLEGSVAGNVRTSWLRTSRIRYGTVEPKLFKLGRIRGSLTAGQIRVDGTTTYETDELVVQGFTTKEPDEFRLPPQPSEWLQLTFTISGDSSTLTSYQVEAIPGARRQRHLQFILSCFDTETTRNGQRIRNALSSRSRLASLEELDARGDEVVLQEFTQQGVVSTLVIIEMLSFKQAARPTRTSDIGGEITLLLRTVES